jgi:hypothetical protein
MEERRVMSPSPGDNTRRPLLDGRAGPVFTVLVVVAVLIMLWTWAGHTIFMVAAGCALVGVFVAGCLRARTGWIELFGGPLDGTRVRSTGGERPPAAGLVLTVPDGALARYSPDGSGRLVYRGHADGD